MGSRQRCRRNPAHFHPTARPPWTAPACPPRLAAVDPAHAACPAKQPCPSCRRALILARLNFMFLKGVNGGTNPQPSVSGAAPTRPRPSRGGESRRRRPRPPAPPTLPAAVHPRQEAAALPAWPTRPARPSQPAWTARLIRSRLWVPARIERIDRSVDRWIDRGCEGNRAACKSCSACYPIIYLSIWAPSKRPPLSEGCGSRRRRRRRSTPPIPPVALAAPGWGWGW
eukprot:scaffold3871_cov45-Phaeocystis_antarctica.AAC.1